MAAFVFTIAPVRRAGFFVSASSEEERQEAFEAQQRVLARRRNKKKQEEYFADVQTRRKEVSETIRAKKLQIRAGEDPIEAWKRLKEEGKIKDLGYEADPEGSIPMPMASFGIPKYDNGERFDLRLPYADTGYEDKDADVMGKVGKFFGGIFGKK
mmetsp:Transcript_21761/g.35992  ORF Transcript_21761/g.35992 Transcript_21761/m.35992 type:complete len:155 (+) Transcript_21761:56-520(+)|eukprot:CAMPEP_0184655744 /NCGR_PEP_ID=MMETSP0308-20130426/14392_1 /TAXON_ID=38269 /ORGANISM="Gloeochaete witrockiana, Strain SAG 46.84" /LENGTH=154 /DNA_ID=CAMNT_0027092465 /DNA_START=56 /DNA_END=520 /DNA_ORIENTATION=+